MIFRLKFFIPVLITIAALFSICYFLKNSIIKTVLETAIPGLTIDESQLDVSTQELGVSIKGELIKEDKALKLITLGDSSMHVHTKPLGFGSVMVKDMVIDDLVIHEALFRADTYKSTVTEIEQTTSPSDGVESIKDESVNQDSLFSLGDQDGTYREILERVTGQNKLQVEGKLIQLENSVKEMTDKYKNLSDENENFISEKKKELKNLENRYKDKGIVEQYKKEYESLELEFKKLKDQKFDIKNIAQIKNNVDQLKKIKNKYKELKVKIDLSKEQFKRDRLFFKNTKASLTSTIDNLKNASSDLKRIKNEVQQVRDAGKSDAEMLKDEINPKNFDAEKIIRLLFGLEYEEKFIEYIGYWQKFKEYLPRPSSEEELISEEEKEDISHYYSNDEVVFNRSPNFPKWAIDLVSYKGFMPKFQPNLDIYFKGSMYHISSDENIYGKPISWDLDGDLKGSQSGNFILKGIYSTTINNKENKNLFFELSGQKIERKSFGPPNMRVWLTGGTMAISIDVDLSQQPVLVAQGSFIFKDNQISIADSVSDIMKKPLLNAMQKVFSQPIFFTLTYEPGWHKPKIKFRGDLNDIFKEFGKAAVMGLVDDKKNELSQKYLAEVTNKLNNKFNQSDFSHSISKYTDKINIGSGDFLNYLLGSDKLNLNQMNGLNALSQSSESMTSSIDSNTQSKKSLEKQLLDQVKKKAEAEARARIEAEKKKLEEELRNRLRLEKEKQEQLNRDRINKEKAEAKRKLEEELKKKAKEQKDKLKDAFKGLF